jgi:hypothetical protein
MPTTPQGVWLLRRASSHVLLCALSATAAVLAIALVLVAEILMTLEGSLLPSTVRWPLLALGCTLLQLAATAAVVRLCGWVLPSRRQERVVRLALVTLSTGVIAFVAAAAVQWALVRWLGWLEGTGGHGYLALLWIKVAVVFCLVIAWLGSYAGAFVARTRTSAPSSGVAVPEGAG